MKIYREILHSLGFCYWGQWSELKDRVDGLVSALSGVTYEQTRKCLICNKYQRRYF